MKKFIITQLLLLLPFLILNAQDVNRWKRLAEEAIRSEQYEKAIDNYQKILKQNSNDIEALKGLADAYLYSDHLTEAIDYYLKAVQLQPDNVSLFFDLAKAYSWNDQLEEAIATYSKILQIDDTYSEAYQGIGKMYYWMEKPLTALPYYERAVQLDPANKTIRDEYNDVKNLTLYRLISTTKSVNEQEEYYEIEALIERLNIAKRLTDYLDISVNGIFDTANRIYADAPQNDTVRSYNATWVNLGLLMNKHKFYLFGGYSFSDEKFSSYGFNYQLQTNIKSVKIKNSLTAGYDYFYYWNYVGKTAFKDDLSFQYRKWKLSLGGQYGIVDKAFLLDVPNDKYYEDENPFAGYNASLGYQIFSQPKLTLSANYSYLNYDQKSNRYYSPLGRSLLGTSLAVYYPMGHFYVYSDVSANFGSEYSYELKAGKVEKLDLNADNWSMNAEAGYNYNQFDISISAGHFYNDYYQNFVVALMMKYRF